MPENKRQSETDVVINESQRSIATDLKLVKISIIALLKTYCESATLVNFLLNRWTFVTVTGKMVGCLRLMIMCKGTFLPCGCEYSVTLCISMSWCIPFWNTVY